MVDPALKTSRDLHLAIALLCFGLAAPMLAMSLLTLSMLFAGLALSAVGVVALVRRRVWSGQADRAIACADDAIPSVATIVSETTGRWGLRLVTLRPDGASEGADFQWRLPASWGELTRLDRSGRRVAVLALRTRRECVVPLLRRGRPFVVPDYLATALVAMLLAEVPPDDRHSSVAAFEPCCGGEVPSPPPLPVTLGTSAGARGRWWLMLGAGLFFLTIGVWLGLRGTQTKGALSGLFCAGVAAAAVFSFRPRATDALIESAGVVLRGPLSRWRGTRRLDWSEVGSVELKWVSRETRNDQSRVSIPSLVVSLAASAAAGVHVHAHLGLDATEYAVGDIAARLLRGDIVPELDTLVVSLLSSAGKPLAISETRTDFQPVRALLRECAERDIPVAASQVIPGGR